MESRDKAEDTYLKKLGKRIKTMRIERGIKQVDLAYKCDMEKQSLNRIEAGNTNPSILLLKKVSDELGVDIKELLNF